MLSWDGTDFRVNNRPNAKLVRKAEQENLPFDPEYYSHKFNGAGLQYYVAICIQTGEIVGAYGPKPAGKWPDINILKKYTVPVLLPGKMVEVDKGLRYPCCRNPEDYLFVSQLNTKKKAASQQEVVMEG